MPCHSDGRGSGPAADPVRPRTRSGRGPGPAASPVRAARGLAGTDGNAPRAGRRPGFCAFLAGYAEL